MPTTITAYADALRGKKQAAEEEAVLPTRMEEDRGVEEIPLEQEEEVNPRMRVEKRREKEGPTYHPGTSSEEDVAGNDAIAEGAGNGRKRRKGSNTRGRGKRISIDVARGKETERSTITREERCDPCADQSKIQEGNNGGGIKMAVAVEEESKETGEPDSIEGGDRRLAGEDKKLVMAQEKQIGRNLDMVTPFSDKGLGKGLSVTLREGEGKQHEEEAEERRREEDPEDNASTSGHPWREVEGRRKRGGGEDDSGRKFGLGGDESEDSDAKDNGSSDTGDQDEAPRRSGRGGKAETTEQRQKTKKKDKGKNSLSVGLQEIAVRYAYMKEAKWKRDAKNTGNDKGKQMGTPNPESQ
ncbi:neurofilament medium polypeptide-like [Hetaerina americana]|uniref:neurofilament medium polypeptide-like n=1 Tax=Hetaerina americana TaxID=62018 RepID=UPI003A7F61EB